MSCLPVQAIGDDMVDSVVGDSIPILTEAEKFNEAVSSIVKRVEARLTGEHCSPFSLSKGTSAGMNARRHACLRDSMRRFSTAGAARGHAAGLPACAAEGENVGTCHACAGKADPGAPLRADGSRKRTYKTKAETDKTRNVTSTIVLTLLGISVIVPMLQVRRLPVLACMLGCRCT